MELKVLKIDPQTAQSMLKRNDKNRKISQRHVKKLASEMVNGRWVLNGQTISFSSDGRLLDGQHRLHAIIDAQTAVMMSVAYGVEDPNAFKSYDQTMLKRSLYHIIIMQGIEKAPKVTAVSRRLTLWEKTVNKADFSLTNEAWKSMADHEVIDYLNANDREILQMLGEMDRSLPYRKCKAGSALIAALIICNRTDEVATMLFMEGLKTGASLAENSPIRFLRDRLIDPPDRTGERWETEVMALTIKAWNKFLQGKTLKYLRWRQYGDAPERFPVPGEK